MKYIPTIGLEIHVELKTQSKMFCSCRNNSDEKEPNKNVCPICMGHPGVLPSINNEAVRKTIKTAIALNCKISKQSYFERKNYFYPDLPKGYQISQFLAPFSKNGFLEIPDKKIRIERIHLEEDTGRLAHPEGSDNSLVDFNRAGVPLMELVTEADIKSAQEAKDFIKEFQLILRYLDVSNANMEKGEMRCEVNISVAKPKADKLGTKVEIKNLNSIASVVKAIEYEIKRQTEILDDGEKVIQETRGWHDKKQISFSQREKEESNDYRYFPEPDLPSIHIEKEFLQTVKLEIPELPAQKRKRFEKEYGLTAEEMELFIFRQGLGEYFENVISELKSKKLIKLANNYISTDLQALLKGNLFNEKEFPITPENFAEFLSLIGSGEISSKIAKTLLKEMFDTKADPSDIIKEKGLVQLTDSKEIEKIAKRVIAENPKLVEDYKNGKKTILQFLIGKVMEKTKGRANPELVSRLFETNLSK